MVWLVARCLSRPVGMEKATPFPNILWHESLPSTSSSSPLRFPEASLPITFWRSSLWLLPASSQVDAPPPWLWVSGDSGTLSPVPGALPAGTCGHSALPWAFHAGAAVALTATAQSLPRLRVWLGLPGTGGHLTSASWPHELRLHFARNVSVK